MKVRITNGFISANTGHCEAGDVRELDDGFARHLIDIGNAVALDAVGAEKKEIAAAQSSALPADRALTSATAPKQKSSRKKPSP